jgi:hypothetical protein
VQALAVRPRPAALQREDTRLEASESLRGLVESIVLTPKDGQLGIELRGNLAAMLTAANNAKRSPETGDLLRADDVGCGGSPWTTSAPLLDGSVNTRFPLLSTEVLDVRRTLGR